jgi:8-oxo-dGTP pyrophosphatase MutT (NUDIX family)
MAEDFVDKIAFLHIKERKVLVALNEGSDVWYLPGGHREPGETDAETLIREVREELAVDIISDTVAYFGTYKAQAHGKPEGKMARITCYTASYQGELEANSEIAAIAFLSYDQQDQTSAPTQLLFDDLKSRDLVG